MQSFTSVQKIYIFNKKKYTTKQRYLNIFFKDVLIKYKIIKKKSHKTKICHKIDALHPPQNS